MDADFAYQDYEPRPLDPTIRTGGFQTESIIEDGSPPMAPVAPAALARFNGVFRVVAYFGETEELAQGGTAFYCAPNRLATAGHVLFDRRFGFARRVELFPTGAAPGAPPTITVGLQGYRVPKLYVEAQAPHLDVGVIFAPTPQGVNILSSAPGPGQPALGQPADVVGYPSAVSRLFGHSRHVTGVTDLAVYHHIDTLEGMSGGPLFHNAARPTVLGIHVHGLGQAMPPGVPPSNVAIRMTPSLKTWLEKPRP